MYVHTKLTCPFVQIALQFPDTLLSDSRRVTLTLRARLNDNNDSDTDNKVNNKTNNNKDKVFATKKQIKNVQVFILADTSYGSCCVDEIAAQHVEADVIIHYGQACLSQ